MQKVLAEKEAENLLEKEGFEIAKRDIIQIEEELQEIEKKISFPWVMKVSSSKILHKAKLGGVITNIQSISEAKEAFKKLAEIKNFEEVIVQETISGEQLIVGLKKTPEFGIVLMFGKGGSKVEEEKDVSFRMLPASKQDIREMIKETKIGKILQEKNIKTKMLEETLHKTAKFAKENPNILELDLNPLFLSNTKAVTADARIIFEE